MYQLPTSPLSIGGVLDDGFRLLRACYGKVVPLAILGVIINVLPIFFAGNSRPLQFDTMPVQLLVVSLLSLICGVVIYAAVIARIDAVAHNREMTVGAALGISGRRFLPFVGCLVLYSLALMAGFLALVIPFFILIVTLSLAPYLIITANKGPLESLRVSHHLVWGNWWRTASLFTVIVFIFFTTYVFVGVLGGTTFALLPGDSVNLWIVTDVIGGLITALVTPLGYVFAYAILNDLQLRKQGDDLDDRIAAIADA